MLRWLWWRVTALVMSHCHGFYPNSQFCAQLQRCCGMDAVGGERALTAASDASRGPMMLMWRSRVHSGATAQSGNRWPHLPNPPPPRAGPLSPRHAGMLSHQNGISMHIHKGRRTGLWAVVWKYVREVLETGKTISSWQDRTTEPLSSVQKTLIRAPPPRPRW